MMRAISRFVAVALVAIWSVGTAAGEKITEHFECSETIDAKLSLHDKLDVVGDKGRITGAHWSAEQWIVDDSTVGHALACDASLEQTGFAFVRHGEMTMALARGDRTCRIDFDRHGDVIVVQPHCESTSVCVDPKRLRPLLLNISSHTCHAIKSASPERKPS